MHLHDKTQERRILIAFDQISQGPAAFLANRVIRIHPENPFALCVAERFVSRERKTVGPGEMIDAAPNRSAILGFVG